MTAEEVKKAIRYTKELIIGATQGNDVMLFQTIIVGLVYAEQYADREIPKPADLSKNGEPVCPVCQARVTGAYCYSCGQSWIYPEGRKHETD